jgi:hypothetical protein
MGSKSSKKSKKDKEENQGKTFYFYYDMSCQNLVVYPGTPSEEIKNTLRDILNIPEKSKLEYLDGDGNPIVISSALPDQIRIYVKIKKSFTDQYIEENKNKVIKQLPNAIDWIWLESSSPSSHKRKNDNKTIFQQYNTCVAKTIGSLEIENGEYYYTLLFEPMRCCVSAGITGSIKNERENKDFSFMSNITFTLLHIWPDIPDNDRGSAFRGKTIEAGFYINMDSKLLILYDNRQKKEVTRRKFYFTKVSPFVEFKHEVSVTITSQAIPGKPDFIKI